MYRLSPWSESLHHRTATHLGQRIENDDFHFLDRWQHVVVMRLRTGHDRFKNAHMYRKMKLAQPPTCNITAVLKTRQPNIITLQRCPLLQTARQSVSVANSSPVTHQTLRQQGGTGEDSHIHLADWTLSVAAIDKKEEEEDHCIGGALSCSLKDSSHTKLPQ